MADCVELEIGLHRLNRQEVGRYSVELRCRQPGSDTSPRPPHGEAELHFDDLRAQLLDPRDYGRLLSEALFPTTGLSDVRDCFVGARSIAGNHGWPLRVRLAIGASAPELHDLRWETLCDPADGSYLATTDRVLFSRYLSSADWRPAPLGPKSALRALVAIASPRDFDETPGRWQPGGRQLAPLDVPGERARAVRALHDMEKKVLARAAPGDNGHASPTAALAAVPTLNDLCDHLRDGYDVLYLVCHGALINGEPVLWLENEDGAADVVSGRELAGRVRELYRQPRLVVLASCQSAGAGDAAHTADEGAQAALGPLLIEAGVPAVVAMQGNVSMATVEAFMPRFFHVLQDDGQIDAAMAAARAAVRERPDAWGPVLFMRLESGRLWSGSGDRVQRAGFDQWHTTAQKIALGMCTPIIGPGLLEPLLGSTRGIARRWAEKHDFPLAPDGRDDLAQVAQYLAVNQDQSYPRLELGVHLRQELLRRYGEELGEDWRNAPPSRLIPEIGARRWKSDPGEPHHVLAELPCKVYLTASPFDLLKRALEAVGKEPRVAHLRWNAERDGLPESDDGLADFEPDTGHPLVFHLFGRTSDPSSVVLTQDDYLDYLTAVTQSERLIPAPVRTALALNALLLLGFGLDDWSFRTLFRAFLQKGQTPLAQQAAKVAVQLDIENDRISNPASAREYLVRYVGAARINIYWGSAEEFLRELQPHLRARQQAETSL
jgi:hypothetical protein